MPPQLGLCGNATSTASMRRPLSQHVVCLNCTGKHPGLLPCHCTALTGLWGHLVHCRILLSCIPDTGAHIAFVVGNSPSDTAWSDINTNHIPL
jgi:hypothetical protein